MSLVTEDEIEQLTLEILRDDPGFEALFSPVLKNSFLL
jgi:hypothetical protein